MRELAIDVRQYGKPEGIGDNIRYSLGLSHKEIDSITPAHDGVFVIVGSGPSCANHVEEIRKEQEEGHKICGIKGAYDYLRERGITPDYYLSVEPRYRPVKNPSHDSVFLLASRVSKKVLEELEDYPILMWHSWSEEDEFVDNTKMYIGGGSTSGLRAVNVAYVMGYRNFRFYGMDSCLGERGEKRVDQEPLADYVEKIDVHVGEREFLCNMAMAAQAQDFQQLYTVMPDITVECVGDGLISAIIEERKKQGLHT